MQAALENLVQLFCQKVSRMDFKPPPPDPDSDLLSNSNPPPPPPDNTSDLRFVVDTFAAWLTSSSALAVQTAALSALAALMAHSPFAVQHFLNLGHLPLITRALADRREDVRSAAATALVKVTSFLKTAPDALDRSVVAALVALLRRGARDRRTRRRVAAAVANICVTEGGRRALLEEGGVEVVCALVLEDDDDLLRRNCATILYNSSFKNNFEFEKATAAAPSLPPAAALLLAAPSPDLLSFAAGILANAAAGGGGGLSTLSSTPPHIFGDAVISALTNGTRNVVNARACVQTLYAVANLFIRTPPLKKTLADRAIPPLVAALFKFESDVPLEAAMWTLGVTIWGDPPSMRKFLPSFGTPPDNLAFSKGLGLHATTLSVVAHVAETLDDASVGGGS
jgi:hypothetical protein